MPLYAISWIRVGCVKAMRPSSRMNMIGSSFLPYSPDIRLIKDQRVQHAKYIMLLLRVVVQNAVWIVTSVEMASLPGCAEHDCFRSQDKRWYC